MSYEVPKRIKTLKSWRASKARALEINPGIICNNALITSIAIQNPVDRRTIGRIKEMKNWQKKEFGDDIVQVLKQVR